MFGGHELPSFNRVHQQDEDWYEFPHCYAFQNEYREAHQHHQDDSSSYVPNEFSREEYLGEPPVRHVSERSIPSPTVSQVLQMRMLHEERRSHGMRSPTSVSVGSHVHSSDCTG